MTRKRRLLVVEDEEAIRNGLIDVFVYHGYEVEAVADGRTGLERALRGGFDLVLLDVMLPGLSGFDVCDAIRARDREQPIIMLTAKVSDEDIVNGLRLGADDYVGKPFGVQELVLRVEAVLRRARGVQIDERSLRIDADAVVDCAALSGTIDGIPVAFTRREVAILQVLARHRDRPVSRDELLAEAWGYARHLGLETRTVDIHIAKLRRKLEQDAKSPARLVTVRGAGYRLAGG
jgi:two-component system response regulator RegX3